MTLQSHQGKNQTRFLNSSKTKAWGLPPSGFMVENKSSVVVLAWGTGCHYNSAATDIHDCFSAVIVTARECVPVPLGFR